MSQENVEIAVQALEAFNRRDKAAWLAFYDPGFENHPPREWPESASTRGPEAAWNFFVTASEPWGEASYEFGEVIDVGDTVVGDQRAMFQGEASGATVAWSYWHVMSFRSAKVVRSQWFSDRADALQAAGVAE